MKRFHVSNLIHNYYIKYHCKININRTKNINRFFYNYSNFKKTHLNGILHQFCLNIENSNIIHMDVQLARLCSRSKQDEREDEMKRGPLQKIAEASKVSRKHLRYLGNI